MPAHPRQLSLAVSLKRRIRLEDFIAGDNHAALAALEATLAGQGEPLLYFWGRTATGKSHLLLGACDRIGQRGGSPAYLSLATPGHLAPEMLDQLDRLSLVCLDDIQGLAGAPEWEEPLFDLFNRLRDQGKPLVVSADAPPSELELQLPDLRSRLAWGAVFHLNPPDDAIREQALIQGAHRIGMTLSPQAAGYLLRHYSRDLGELFEFLDHLDQATLEAQNRPTIPFLKQVIQRERPSP